MTGMRARMRPWAILLLVGYGLLVGYWMLYGFGREENAEQRFNLEPLETIKAYWSVRDRLPRVSAMNLAGNVLVFVPFGFLIPIALGGGFWRMFLVHTLGVVGLELAQLITRRGSLDVDDLILNTLGAVIGYVAFRSLQWLYRRWAGV